MAITTPPRKTETRTTPPPAVADKFISGAPDSGKAKGVWKGKKRQISITLAPELLDQIDALSAEYGQSRAAVIGMAIYQAVKHGLLKGER
jgi:hypothetical protein